MLNMPKVSMCDATDCAYNSDTECHALAITINGGSDHNCGTYLNSSLKGGDPQVKAGVGACHTSGCSFNSNLECHAPEITVGHEANKVDCLTYKP